MALTFVARAEMRELVRDLRLQLRSGAAPALPTPAGRDGDDGPAPLSAKEREELAVRLLASEGKPLDAQASARRSWDPGLRQGRGPQSLHGESVASQSRWALTCENLL